MVWLAHLRAKQECIADWRQRGDPRQECEPMTRRARQLHLSNGEDSHSPCTCPSEYLPLRSRWREIDRASLDRVRVRDELSRFQALDVP